MATHENGYSQLPDPKAVSTEFVTQYYKIINSAPQHGHRFYQEASEMLRPGPDGLMTPVTSLQGINEKILSMDYDKSKIEILSADAQASYKGGFLVLVTGYIKMANDKVKRTFIQSFYLAPQENGYYVHSDIFRYVDNETSAPPSVTVTAEEDVQAVDVPVTASPEPTQVSAEPESHDVHEEVEEAIAPTKSDQSVDNGVDSIPEKETVVSSSVEVKPKEVAAAVLPSPPVTQEAVVPPPASPAPQADAPKMSYAAMVHALSSKSQPFQVRASPAKVVKQSAPTASEASVPNGVPPPAAVKSSAPPTKRYSIFVGSLPMNAIPKNLEDAFSKFGPIKPDGIQVRSSKGSCFGFVEFESESSLRSALEEKSIMIADKLAHIEEQRNDGNDRVRVPQGRGGFRGDNFRGRGGFAGGRGAGYGRNDFEKRSDFGGRGGGRNGGGYNREFQNGGGRGPRQETGVKN